MSGITAVRTIPIPTTFSTVEVATSGKNKISNYSTALENGASCNVTVFLFLFLFLE
jgi:hypothetical protein